MVTGRRTLVALVTVFAVGARADLAPLGNEFVVNTYTTYSQRSPVVAVAPDGGFVVVWDGFGDGAYGAFAQHYDAAGQALGGESQVAATETDADAVVGMDAAGRFVVAWTGGLQYPGPGPDGDGQAVLARMFDAAGAPVGDEFVVNEYTTGNQSEPALAVTPDGDFVVVWNSAFAYGEVGGDGPDGSAWGVFGRRFDATGTPLGSDFQVNAYTTGPQWMPAVSGAGDGFVVVWTGGYSSYFSGADQDGSGSGVFGRRLDVQGLPFGDEFQVNAGTIGAQYQADVAMGSHGDFVVVWTGAYAGGDGSYEGLFARRFGRDAAPLGDEIAVNALTDDSQRTPAVARDARDGFVVVWQTGDETRDGDGAAIIARHFTADASPVGEELLVNSYTTFSQRSPSIAATPNGFVIAWGGSARTCGGYCESYPGRDGYSDAAVARRFEVTAFEPPVHPAGSKLLLRTKPGKPEKSRLLLVAKDDVVGAGAADDPTVDGGTFRLVGSVLDLEQALPAANWSAMKNGWRYDDPKGSAGPIRSVRLKDGKRLKAVGRGEVFAVDLGDEPSPLDVTLQIGEHGSRHCLRFGGDVTYKPGKLFRATHAPVSTTCVD